MADGIIPPIEILRQLLRYDPETGKLYRVSDGREACSTRASEGYLKGSLLNSRCYAHRVIWKLVYGEEPAFIDHINGVRSDNRLANLRAATFADNMRNRQTPTNNTSGTIGVSWNRRVRRWMASIRYEGRRYARWFDNKDDAINWRREMEAGFGFHVNHGR